jgi:hypothetical protein
MVFPKAVPVLKGLNRLKGLSQRYGLIQRFVFERTAPEA